MLAAIDAVEAALGPPPAGYKYVKAILDSGAEETVTPPDLFSQPVVESAMQRAGGRYRAANGTRIPNLGEQRVPFQTADGHRCILLFQVAPIEKPLISVAQLSRAGNRVVLDDAGGFIENKKSGQKMRVTKEGNTYTLIMNVKTDPGPATGFARRGSP